MADVRAFRCVRPSEEVVSRVAALPYDVYNRKEAKAIVEENPHSFLAIDRPETQFGDDVDIYDNRVYAKARQMLDEWMAAGIFLADETDCYYIYELVMEGSRQTGIVACTAVDDYLNQVIKKHENTREEKEQDRIRHVDVTDANTGPIFLAYRSRQELNELVMQVCQTAPLYDFVAEDGITHRVWRVSDAATVQQISTLFGEVPALYIADGHHRAASAVKVGLKRRQEQPDYDGTEPFNFFLSVLFPDEQLKILPYYRAVEDLGKLSLEAFLNEVKVRFTVENLGKEPYQPAKKASFGMYLDGTWYRLTPHAGLIPEDLIGSLDVSVLQDGLLAPVLGIDDPRTDDRISFIGGIRGLKELERLVDGGMAVAFSLYPTSIQELLDVADAELLMPPKSTWFEPKLRSGLFIHKLTQ